MILVWIDPNIAETNQAWVKYSFSRTVKEADEYPPTPPSIEFAECDVNPDIEHVCPNTQQIFPESLLYRNDTLNRPLQPPMCLIFFEVSKEVKLSVYYVFNVVLYYT